MRHKRRPLLAAEVERAHEGHEPGVVVDADALVVAVEHFGLVGEERDGVEAVGLGFRGERERELVTI